MIKRFSDILFSFLGLLVLFPFFLLISLCIICIDGFPVFYNQKRVGRKGRDFFVMKFRTMKKDAEKKGALTISSKDPRITRTGSFLRKYKIDELPQLFNVLFGDMSLVGPRPEVRKYVNLYNRDQLKVLEVKPGITDPASIEFANENELLGRSKDPEKTYINEIMPAKLKLNLEYIRKQNFFSDLGVIFRTIFRVLG